LKIVQCGADCGGGGNHDMSLVFVGKMWVIRKMIVGVAAGYASRLRLVVENTLTAFVSVQMTSFGDPS